MDRHQSIQSPNLQDISIMRSASNTQNQINQNNSNCNTPVNNGAVASNNFGFQSATVSGIQFLKMRRKSSEQNDDHLNDYIKKYHNLANVINNHEKKQQQQQTDLQKFLANQAFMQKRNTEQRDKQNPSINLHKQRKSVLFTQEFSVFQQLQSKREISRLGSNNNLEMDGRTRPKRQTLTQSTLQQQNQLILPELALEHTSSSKVSFQREEMKIQKSQSDLSKLNVMKQYKETKKIQDTINFVDYLLKIYKRKQSQNISAQSQNEQITQKTLPASIQSPQLTRRQSRDIQVQSLERNTNTANKSVELHLKNQNLSTEKYQQKRVLSEPKSRQNKNFQFKNIENESKIFIPRSLNNNRIFNNSINDNNNNNNKNNNHNYDNNSSQFNTQESLQQFANRHISQSNQLLMRLTKKDIRKMKINPSQTEINTLSRIFSKKSPLLTPLKAPDKQSQKLVQVIKLDNGGSLNESQIIYKNTNIPKYTTYLQNQSFYTLRKQAIFPNTQRYTTNNTNGHSNNQSIDFLKLSTEASSPDTKKFNRILKKMF